MIEAGDLPLGFNPGLTQGLPSMGGSSAGIRAAAASLLGEAGLETEGTPPSARSIPRPHPAAVADLRDLENPLSICNRRLEATGAARVD